MEHDSVSSEYLKKLIDFDLVSQNMYSTNLNDIAKFYYNNFFINNVFKMDLIFAFVVMVPVVVMVDFCLSHWFAQEKRIKFRNWWRDHIFSRFFFSTTLTLLNLTFYPFMVSALLEINAWQKSNSYQMQSFVFSWFVVVANLLLLATLWAIPTMHTHRHDHPLFRFRFRMFYWPFKPYFWSMLFTPLFATRRLLHLLLVVFFQHTAFVPQGLQLLISLLFLGYLLAVRPFRNKLCTVTAILLEGQNLAMQILFLPFIKDEITMHKINVRPIIFRFIFAVIVFLIVWFSLLIWWRALDYVFYRRHGFRRDTCVHRLERRLAERLRYQGL